MAEGKSDSTAVVVLGVTTAVLGVAAAFFGYKFYQCNVILKKIYAANPNLNPANNNTQ